MSNFKKLLTIAVTAMTVIWSVGIVSVPTVQAAASAGDLIKMAGNPAVYYFDGSKRYVFPNQDTYMSWYKDFSGVKTVPSSELMSYTIGGNVTMRAGTWLVKITTDPKVYAVSTGGKLHAIDSEARAAKLYGSTWNKMIKDVPDAFFVNYSVDTAISSDVHPDGAIVKYANSSTYYEVEGGKKRAFASEAALAANMVNTSFAVTTDITYGDGSSVTGKEAAMTNVAGSSVNSGPVSTGSGLSVALASDTPVSASVPKSGTNIKFLAMNFTAGNDGAVILDGFTLRRMGVGSSANFSGVYVYDGANRLTSSRTINSSSNEVSFTGLNLSIPAGTTKKVYVTADISDSVTSGQTSNLVLESATGVTTVGSGVTVSGNFPVTGNMMTFVDVNIGTLTVSKSGSVSTPKVGQSTAKISEFKLSASTEDISVNRVTLYQAGSISRSNLTNFGLYVQGSSSALATVSSINTKDLVVFDLSTPYTITQGNDRIFEVYADIGGSAKANDTIKLYVDETSDLSAIGQTYGYGSKITNNFNSTSGNYHSLTLEGGKLTVTFEGPTNTTIAKNTNDYAVFKFNMTAAQAMEIRKMTFTLASPSEDNDANDTTGLIYDTSADTPDTLNFQDVKVKDLDSGLIVTSTKELSASGSDASQDIIFTDYFTLTAGTTRHFALLVDAKDTNPNANDLQVTMKLDDSQADFTAKSLDTSDFITDIVPSVDLTGNIITVNTSTLTIGVASTPVSDTYVKRTTGIPAVGFTFQASTASDVTVTSVKLTGYVDNDDSGTFTANTDGNIDINNLVNAVRLYEGDDLSKPLVDAKSLSSDGTVTFSGLTWKIPAGTTYKLVLRADASDSVSLNNRVKFGIANTTDVTAQDKDSNTSTVSGTPNSGTADSGTRVTFATSGTLSVIKDATTPNAGVVLAGTNNVLFTAVKWSATREDFQVKKFNVTDSASTTYGLISGIRIAYKDASGATVNAGPYALDSNGTAAIDVSTNPVIVKKGDTTVLSIYADVASFATTDGSDSGLAPVLNLQALNATPTGGIDWEAVGASSGTSIGNANNITTSAIGSNTQLVYKAYPTLTNPSWTPVSTPTNSEMEIYKWGVAATGGSIAVKQMGLKITISDTGTDTTETLGNFKLYRDSNDITSQVRIVDQGGADLKASTSFGESDTTAYIIFGSDAQSEETIPAGTTYNYVLRATAAGFTTPADDDSFRVEMLSDSSASGKKQLNDADTDNSQIVVTLTSGENAGAVALPQYLIWSDNSAIPHSAAVPEENSDDPADTSSGDWTNGYLIKNMPLSQTSFVY